MHPAALNRIRGAEEEEEEHDQWQGLVDRARTRAHLQTSRRADPDDDWEEYVLQENDVLWEIGCKVSIANILLSL